MISHTMTNNYIYIPVDYRVLESASGKITASAFSTPLSFTCIIGDLSSTLV